MNVTVPRCLYLRSLLKSGTLERESTFRGVYCSLGSVNNHTLPVTTRAMRLTGSFSRDVLSRSPAVADHELDREQVLSEVMKVQA